MRPHHLALVVSLGLAGLSLAASSGGRALAAETVVLEPSTQDLSLGLSCQGQSTYNSSQLFTIKASLACYGFDALVQFDTAPVAGRTVLGATLKLYQINAQTNYGAPWQNHRIAAYPNRAPWAEVGTTFANAPAVDASAPYQNAITITNAAGVWREWNVTRAVQDWATGAYPNNGLRLAPLDEGQNADLIVYYYAREATDAPELRPRLVVELEDADASERLVVTGTQAGAVGYSRVSDAVPDPQTAESSARGISQGSHGVALGDFDEDGDVDYLQAGTGGGTARLELHRRVAPGGTFGPAELVASRTGAPVDLGDLAVADFDEDGHLDVAWSLRSGLILLYLGHGDGTFHLHVSLGAYWGSAYGVDAADMNGDGHADIVALAQGYGPTPKAVLLYGNGAGGFTSQPVVLGTLPGAPTYENWIGVAAGDFDGDGVADLMTVGWYFGSWPVWWRGLGGGAFETSPRRGCEWGAYGAKGLDDGDFDGDGDLDIVYVTHGGLLQICRNDGAGVFTPTQSRTIPGGAAYAVSALPYAQPPPPDTDGDGLVDGHDNCPSVANPDQLNTDGDALGDVCDTDDDGDGVLDEADVCPLDADPAQVDTDGDLAGDVCDDDDDNDGVPDPLDACPLAFDPDQADLDGDGLGDACDDDDDGDGVADAVDTCPTVPDPDQLDTDGDLAGDACDDDDDGDGTPDAFDSCPLVAGPQGDADGDGQGDVCDGDDDGDGVADDVDTCPLVADPDQEDLDGDGLGDACDDDDDGDGVADDADVCAMVADPGQEDLDGDGLGDACDADDDGDGVLDVVDTCPTVADPSQADLDGDGLGDACDADDDGDGVDDVVDTCPTVADPDQGDLDGDGLGDACDADDDGDGVDDVVDTCPTVADPSQADLDGDGLGDACDADDDGDGVPDVTDVCATVADPDQADLDADGLGDACDGDDDGDTVPDGDDNCATTPNPGQGDLDMDGVGDACDPDLDGDDVPDVDDNCPGLANADQADADLDGQGDACDGDGDGDGVANDVDNCPWVLNGDQLDLDADGEGDACDDDLDGDLLPNGEDNCATTSNPNQADLDGDGLGDPCDPDVDGDGVDDTLDDCPRVVDPDQLDTDGDGLGDACDPDDDDDDAFDGVDNCPTVENPDQTDTDGDGQGNACDADDDGDGVSDVDDDCPLDADPEQIDTDDDGAGDACDPDDDDDGVPDAADSCPGTATGLPVTPDTGCSVAQLCPCAGPAGQSVEWRNHGRYQSCVAQAAGRLRDLGLISDPQASDLAREAAGSRCGRNPCRRNPLAPQPAAGAPFLRLTIAGYQAWGPDAPPAPRVFAGATELAPAADGTWRVPLVSAGGAVIADALRPRDLRRGAIPRGVYVFLRDGEGGVVHGLSGFLPRGSKVSIDATTAVVQGVDGAWRNLSFEGHGNGTAEWGRAGRDEIVKGLEAIRALATVTRAADLVSVEVCRP